MTREIGPTIVDKSQTVQCFSCSVRRANFSFTHTPPQIEGPHVGEHIIRLCGPCAGFFKQRFLDIEAMAMNVSMDSPLVQWMRSVIDKACVEAGLEPSGHAFRPSPRREPDLPAFTKNGKRDD